MWNYESYRQLVVTLGRGISPSQGRYLHRTTPTPKKGWNSNSAPQCYIGRRHFVFQTERPQWSTTENQSLDLLSESRLHGMMRPQVADGEDNLQIQRVAVTVLFRTANRGWNFSLGVGRVLTIPQVTIFCEGLRIWWAVVDMIMNLLILGEMRNFLSAERHLVSQAELYSRELVGYQLESKRSYHLGVRSGVRWPTPTANTPHHYYSVIRSWSPRHDY
jgi:hypothetical protein